MRVRASSPGQYLGLAYQYRVPLRPCRRSIRNHCGSRVLLRLYIFSCHDLLGSLPGTAGYIQLWTLAQAHRSDNSHMNVCSGVRAGEMDIEATACLTHAVQLSLGGSTSGDMAWNVVFCKPVGREHEPSFTAACWTRLNSRSIHHSPRTSGLWKQECINDVTRPLQQASTSPKLKL